MNKIFKKNKFIFIASLGLALFFSGIGNINTAQAEATSRTADGIILDSTPSQNKVKHILLRDYPGYETPGSYWLPQRDGSEGCAKSAVNPTPYKTQPWLGDTAFSIYGKITNFHNPATHGNDIFDRSGNCADRYRDGGKPSGGAYLPPDLYGGWALPGTKSWGTAVNTNGGNIDSAKLRNVNVSPRIWSSKSVDTVDHSWASGNGLYARNGWWTSDQRDTMDGNKVYLFSSGTTLFRNEFNLAQHEYDRLKEIYVDSIADDWVKIWINGNPVLSTTQTVQSSKRTLTPGQAQSYLQPGKNVIAFQVVDKSYWHTELPVAAMASGLWYNIEIVLEDTGDIICSNNICYPDPCAPRHNSYQCVDYDGDGDGDDIYWFDACGEINDKKEFCGPETSNGAWNDTCYMGDLYQQRDVVTNGCSLSVDVCTTNKSVEKELKEDCVYDCFDKKCWIPEIDVSLIVDPSSGEEPLYSTITAEIKINRAWSGWGASSFHIWWNCSSSTTNVAQAEASCGVLPSVPPGTCASNTNGYRCVGVNKNILEIQHAYVGDGDNDKTCNPPNNPSKTYSTKVIAEKVPAPENATATETVKVDPLIIPDCLPPTTGAGEEVADGNLTGRQALIESIGDIIWIILMIVTPLAVSLYIFAGVRLFFAGGSANSVASAKKIFAYTTMGYGLVVLGWIIIYAISR